MSIKNIDDAIDAMTDAHFDMACGILQKAGGKIEEPDLVIAPDGEPYLFRWHLFPFKGPGVGCYFHVQVKSDPERPLHDHPWDNTSVILAGGYDEIMQREQLPRAEQYTLARRTGDMISRRADEAHRLVLPPGVPYTMTTFLTGPKLRDWGFWYPDGWHHYKRHVAFRADGASVHVQTEGD